METHLAQSAQHLCCSALRAKVPKTLDMFSVSASIASASATAASASASARSYPAKRESADASRGSESTNTVAALFLYMVAGGAHRVGQRWRFTVLYGGIARVLGTLPALVRFLLAGHGCTDTESNAG